jgi:guanylate kinase
MQEIILHHKEEFRELLETYQPSDVAIQVLSQMPLVIMQGITGSGRNTIISYLAQHLPYHQVISDTTRPPKIRDGKMEKEGVAYFFRTEEGMLDDLRNGMLLEAELIHEQQVSGISIRELERARKSGKVPINEVAREGVENIRRAKPDTRFFFVVPPNYDEWIARLHSREVMTDEEFANRKQSAILELQTALEADFYAFVVNNTVEQAARDIEDTRLNGIDQERQEHGRRAAQAILDELTAR